MKSTDADPTVPDLERQPTQPAAPPRRTRLGELDLLRGTIMIVMAWDHCKDNVANRVPPHDTGSQMWSGPFGTFDQNFGLFMARFISHFCAPGFFWLMGVGIALFDLSRNKRDWKPWRRSKHFLIRGAVLLVMARLINVASILQNVPTWGAFKAQFGGTDASLVLLSIFEVLTSLGLTLGIVGACVPLFTALHLKPPPFGGLATWGVITVMLLGLVSFVVSNVAVYHFQHEQGMLGAEFPSAAYLAASPWELLVRFVMLPGKTSVGIIAYPLFPWIGLALFGVAHGYFFASCPARTSRWCGWLGLSCLACFVLIRLVGGPVGNYRGWSRHERESGDFISFFNVCKYPPSLAYCLLTMSVNLGLVRLYANYSPPEERPTPPATDYAQLKDAAESGPAVPGPASWSLLDRLLEVVKVFGQVPLFFYMLHFFLLGTMGLCVHSLDKPGLDLGWALLFWLCALVPLFFACKRYAKFKNSTEPESLWRLL